jgi:hypothetical protein
MRKWKDNELPIPRKKLALLYIGIFGSLGLAASNYFIYGTLFIENYVAIGLCIFIIYCLKFGGGYKIARYMAERKARRSDNDWHPHWQK